MTPQTTTWLLTGLATLVVVLTRLRLRREDAAGVVTVPPAVSWAHTIAGLVAIGLWVALLVTEDDVYGWPGLAFWWITTLAGLLILLRWMPSKGRHGSDATADAWGDGPGLSILAHVGMLAAAVIFTVFLVLDKLP